MRPTVAGDVNMGRAGIAESPNKGPPALPSRIGYLPIHGCRAPQVIIRRCLTAKTTPRTGKGAPPHPTPPPLELTIQRSPFPTSPRPSCLSMSGVSAFRWRRSSASPSFDSEQAFGGRRRRRTSSIRPSFNGDSCRTRSPTGGRRRSSRADYV